MADGPPPPPPPPHGDNPRTTAGGNMPKYEIFMIPAHSAGGGFLYLPSLQPSVNSFVAGFASALMCVVVFQSLSPAIQQWWAEFQGMGNMGMMMLVVAVGLGAWAFGRQQADGNGQGQSKPDNERRRGPFTSAGTSNFSGGPGAYTSSPPPPPPHNSPPPNTHAPPPHSGPPPRQASNSGSFPGQEHQPPPSAPDPTRPERPKQSFKETPQPATPKNAWEKAREETRKREEERRAREADQKRREEAARRLRELREKEAREREQRERDKAEREQREKEAREREAKDKERIVQETRMREQREKELRERLERERQMREKMEQEAKAAKEKLEKERKEREAREAKEREERLRKEEEESKTRKGSTYAYSSVGERMSMWPNGRPPAAASSQPASPAAAPQRAWPSATSTAASPTKQPPPPTAKSAAGTEDEYSYRPYDKPKRPAHKKSVSDFSETSWAPSQSTARTTPPPSMRGPYTTKDPDKIVIRAVYCFVNQFAKTPASQLISGVGTVTDGLILRITTEGLFIDDDVRGVPQREWDVKAWTLKLVEVWCPTHSLNSSSASSTPATPANHPFFKTIPARRNGADRGAPKTLVGDEADAFLVEMLRACKDNCRLGNCPFTSAAAAATKSPSSSVSGSSNSHKTGDWKAKGLHLLRATVRDQEGKRYLFVLSEEESWKVSIGLQRLRRGTQVRALGVSTFSQLEAKTMLETLGW